jgi:hypothetical protein
MQNIVLQRAWFIVPIRSVGMSHSPNFGFLAAHDPIFLELANDETQKRRKQA